MSLEEHGLALLMGARIVGQAAASQREEQIRRAAAVEALREAGQVWDTGKKRTLVGEYLSARADAIEAGEL